MSEQHETLVALGMCPFVEDVHDASMCQCGLPALDHDAAARSIFLGDHPGLTDLLDRLAAAVARAEAAERKVAAVEGAGDLDAAIARVEESRQTHVEWLDYWRAYDQHDCSGVACPWEATRAEQEAIAGDSDHQQTVISGYDNVLAILNAIRAALDTAADPTARIKAEALREAAAAIIPFPSNSYGAFPWGAQSWLRDRAAALDTAADPDTPTPTRWEVG